MEKLQLFKDCDVIIYNGDNELISNSCRKVLVYSPRDCLVHEGHGTFAFH